MKKVLCSMLAILLLVPAFASAEVDVRALSTEELLALRVSIVDELMARGEMKSANVPAGEYIVGEDIPAGSYSITTDQILVTVVIGDYDGMYVVSPDSPVGKITLKDGDKFQITGNIVLTKYAGLSFE